MSQPQAVKVWLIKPAGRPFYQLQWRNHATGKLKTESTKTADKTLAQEKRANREYELNHGMYAEPSKMTWSAFRDVYELEKLSGCRDNSQDKAGSIFDAFEKLANPRTIGDINERMLSQYAAKLRQGDDKRRPFKETTICGHLAYLKAALRWAHGQKMIPEVPRFTMPKVAKGTNRAKVVKASKIGTEAYERLLMKAPNDGWRLFIAFCWHCGMRRNEARAVKGVDVELKARRIRLPDNKAGDEAAVVIITPELDALLRERWPDGLPEGALITVADVTSDPHELTKQFKRIAKRAALSGSGKDGYCTIHDLRRSFGSRWAGRVPAQVLQRMMRHSSIEVTLTFYADTEQAAEDAIWGGQPAARSQKAAPNEAPNYLEISQV